MTTSVHDILMWKYMEALATCTPVQKGQPYFPGRNTVTYIYIYIYIYISKRFTALKVCVA